MGQRRTAGKRPPLTPRRNPSISPDIDRIRVLRKRPEADASEGWVANSDGIVHDEFAAMPVSRHQFMPRRRPPRRGWRLPAEHVELLDLRAGDGVLAFDPPEFALPALSVRAGACLVEFAARRDNSRLEVAGALGQTLL